MTARGLKLSRGDFDRQASGGQIIQFPEDASVIAILDRAADAIMPICFGAMEEA
jgi:hypothetical protein